MTTTYDSNSAPARVPSMGDNLEQRFALNFGESNLTLGRSVGARTLRRHGVIAVDYGTPAGYFNSAVLTEPPTADMLRQVDQFFADGKGDVEVFSPWPVDDLAGLDWGLGGHPPFMLRPRQPVVPARNSDMELRPVANPAELKDWERVAIEGFPFPGVSPGTLIGPDALRDERLRMWVGYRKGAPVAIGTSFDSHGVVAFMLGVTVPEARGRGYWTDLAVARISAAPAATFVSINSDDSQPGARKLGFIPVTRWHVWKKRR